MLCEAPEQTHTTAVHLAHGFTINTSVITAQCEYEQRRFSQSAPRTDRDTHHSGNLSLWNQYGAGRRLSSLQMLLI